MAFAELVEACLDKALVPPVRELLDLKMQTSELGLGPRIDVINNYLDATISEMEEVINTLPKEYSAS